MLACLPGQLAAQMPCDCQVALSALQVAILQTAARERDRQSRIAGEDVGGKPSHRLTHRGRAAREEQLQPVVGDQVARLLPSLPGQGVADGGHRLSLVRVPAGRATMQERDLAWVGVVHVGAQELPEERMEAVPALVAVDLSGVHGRPGVLERGERQGAAVQAGERVGQLRGEGVDDAGAQHELAPVLGEVLEHLRDQVVGDRAVGAGELGEETRWARGVRAATAPPVATRRPSPRCAPTARRRRRRRGGARAAGRARLSRRGRRRDPRCAAR